MKKPLKSILTVVLTLSLLLSLGIAAFAQSSVVFFDKSKNIVPVILIRPDAEDAEREAAQTLQLYLEQAFGTKPEIIDAVKNAGMIGIIKQDSPGAKKGSFTMKIRFEEGAGAVLEIAAADARGLKNGVYAFLEEFCGVRIYSADVKTVPELSTLLIDDNYSYSYVPALEYADTDWISPHDREFALANGLNGTYSPLEATDGGKVNYMWFCHSLATSIVPQGELFESHPEYYALTKNGKREPTQLCLSNPDVLERAIEDVRKQLEASYNPDAAVNIVSVTQSDNQDYCLCDDCNAIAEEYGGQSGLMIWFVNQIADALGGDYPDVVFDTFAYQYTRQAPINIVPRENVCVRLCSIECCFAHALDDPDCEWNVKFMKDLEDWSKICSRLYVWDYVTNFVQTLGIFPNFGVLRQNINVFREHNVVGIYEEGNYYASSCNTEFADLRAYELARNLREPLTEEQNAANRKAFLDAYYGEGGEDVGQIIDFLTAHAGGEDGHLGIYFSMKSSLHDVTKEDISRIDGLWESALNKTRDAGNTDAEARIARSKISWDYYEACAGVGNFRYIFGIPNVKANRALIKAINDSGATRYNEGCNLADVNMKPFISPGEWTDSDFASGLAVKCACSVLALTLAVALLALIKKRFSVAVSLILIAAVGAPFGAWASKLFVEWDNLPLYALIDAVFLLSIAGFGFVAAWCVNGFKIHKGKKAVIVTLITLAAAATPYEIAILCINTLKYHGMRPTHSIALSALVPMAIIVAELIITAVCLTKKNKTEK